MEARLQVSESLKIERESGILCRAITRDGAVRVVAVRSEEAARAMCTAHGLRGDAAAIAAEGLVATAMMSAHIKGDERMTIQVQSSEPLLSFFAEINANGAVRGRLKPARVEAPTRRLNGVLLAIKSTADREVYRGATSVEHDTISEALQGHLSDSVQIDGLLWTHGGAGVLIERLPGPDGRHELTLDEFKRRYGRLRERPPAAIVEALLKGQLGEEEVVVLGVRSLYWACACSQERVMEMLATLGEEVITQIIEEDGAAEVICHFCNQPYPIDLAQLKAIRNRVNGAAKALDD